MNRAIHLMSSSPHQGADLRQRSPANPGWSGRVGLFRVPWQRIASAPARSVPLIRLASGFAAEHVSATPQVGSSKLQNITDLYEGTTNPGRVGTGTTADAVRYELETGGQVFSRSHVQKAEDYLRGLDNWPKVKPDVDYYDRRSRPPAWCVITAA